MDCLPFCLDEVESREFLKKIPENISSIGVQWGFNDTVFRDNLMEYVVKEVLGFKSVEEYYTSDLFLKYKNEGQLLPTSMLLGETKRYKIAFSITYLDKELNESPGTGDFEMVSQDLDTTKKNAFFELARVVFKKGYVIKKLELLSFQEIK